MKLFPVVDISYVMEQYGCDQSPSERFLADEKVQQVSKELLNAFSEWGFIYLKGYGISDEFVANAFQISRDYFTQSTDEKNKTAVSSNDLDNFYGYVPFKYENFDSTKPYDLKEAYDFLPWMNTDFRNQLPEKFVKMFDDLYVKCISISYILCRLLGIALNLDDISFFEKCHKNLLTDNITILRSLYYPSMKETDVQPLQTRCGEHSDYGTVTLLFQDDIGGLEVQSPSGEFISATPIPETIVVNAADLLERWTSGKIKSTRHRVCIPKDTSKARQSIAFFCQPDNDCIVSCLDGSNIYEPVNSKDYIGEQFKKTYTSLENA